MHEALVEVVSGEAALREAGWHHPSIDGVATMIKRKEDEAASSAAAVGSVAASDVAAL